VVSSTNADVASINSTPTSDVDELLTVQDVAKLLNVPTS
jgi:hypothetical protein